MALGAEVLACTGAGMGLWWPIGAALTIAFWGLLIWGGVILARRSGIGSSSRRAEETLAERYASGDLDDEEYR